MLPRALFTAFIAAALSNPTRAAEPPALERLFQRPRISDVKISPGGEYLALRVYAEKRHALRFLTRDGFEMLGGIDVKLPDAQTEVGAFWWVNDERVIGTIVETPPGESAPRFYGELFATNFDSSRQEFLFGFRSANFKSSRGSARLKSNDRAWAQYVDRYPQDPKRVIIARKGMSKKQDKRPVARFLDVYTGFESGANLARADHAFADFFVDQTGAVRVIVSEDDQQDRHVKVRKTPAADWESLPSERFGDSFTPLSYAGDNNTFYALDRFNSDRVGLHRYHLASGERSEIYTPDRVDLSGVELTKNGREIYAMRVFDGYPKYLMLKTDAPESALFRDLLSVYPGKLIEITSRSDDGRYWVIYTHSDTDPGSFHLFDQREKSVVNLFQQRSGLERAALAPMQPIAYKSFDGRAIHGYFTPASGFERGKAPMLVLVHGGPIARDYWGYDPFVQALATSGIAVLQLNYRGSAGYGAEHQIAGRREWGRNIQKDIISGTRWAIGEGLAPADKVCIGGASFGAYSAVMSGIIEPALYCCIVASAGIYDLELLYKRGDIHAFYGGKNYIRRNIGEDADELRAFSPVHHVDRLAAPVLLAHGKKDQRAPYRHAADLRKALKKHNKPFELMIERREGHGFYTAENQVELARRTIEFVKRHAR